MILLKYLTKFWNKPEMPINTSLILNWFAKFFTVAGTVANQEPAFAITNTKFYVRAVTLLTQDNAKLLQQLKSGFRKNWNKYLLKVTIKRQIKI